MSASEPSDPELVRRSLAGEASAFAQLVAKHQRLVFGVALSGARDPAHAEDVAQQAFVEAWRELPRLRDHGRVGSWIAGIARNLARGWSRRSTRRRKREQAALQAESPAVATPLDSALDRETRSLVRDALEEIPAAYREVLVLYYMQGRSAAEVASTLGISVDLVKQRLSRGRRALRTSLEDRVESTLQELAPGKTFTATVMVAVSTAVTREASAMTTASAAGKVMFGMSAGKFAASGAAVAVAAGIGWYSMSGASEPTQAPADSPAAATARSPHDSHDARDSTPRGEHLAVRRLANADARAQLLQAIRSAQQRRARAATASGPRSAPPPAITHEDLGDMDREYIRNSVRALLPLITECYETALETDPTLAGALVVNFTIEGEPDVGGLVTESSINDDGSEIRNESMRECLQETMFALEIDPPTNGGTVKVTYPFTFSPRE